MSETNKTRLKRIAIFFLLSLTLIIVGTTLFFFVAQLRANSVAAKAYEKAEQEYELEVKAYERALALWEAKGIMDYRLQIKRNRSWEPSCVTDILVSNGIPTTINTDCEDVVDPVNTIPQLFALIEDVTYNVTCGPNGCECDGPIVVMATYDEQYGFLQKIRTGIHPRLRLRYTGFWPPNICTLIGHGGIELELTHFERIVQPE